MLHNLRQMVLGGLMTEERKGRGGPRPGSGRKLIGDTPMVKITVTLPQDVIEQLEQLGEGNISAGIREAMRRLGALAVD